MTFRPDTADSDVQSVAFISLGCAKNLVDSERMLGLLASDGIAVTPDPADADAVVINTCGFLEASKQESMAEIHEAIRLKTSGRVKRVVVAGCLVQRHKTKLLAEAPGIDRLVGVFDRDRIVEAVRGACNPRAGHGHFLGKYHELSGAGRTQGLESVGMGQIAPVDVSESARDGDFAPGDESQAARILRKQALGKRGRRLPLFEDDRGRFRLTPRHFAYLRISEGCNQGCAFCTIPSIRGPMRSKPVEQILAEARELSADGAVEILLIGQDTTSYGTDIGYAPGLAGLLRRLDRELARDVAWIRLMYAYPSCFTDEMIDALAGCGRVLKYVDMPLQHISDAVLSRMKRKVSKAQTLELLGKLRQRIPGIALRTTLIAGSPGETDSEHAELVEFVREGWFEHLGVFAYSAEPGTPMGRMAGQVPEELKQGRLEELMLAQQQVVFARNAGRIGQSIEVLIERPHDQADTYIARSRRQAPEIDSVTYVSSHEPLHAGQILDVTISDYQHYDQIAAVPRKARRELAVLAR